MDTKRENSAPICSHCAEPMRLTLTISDSGALPELHTYYCKECEVTVLRRASRESGGFLSLRGLKKLLLTLVRKLDALEGHLLVALTKS
jgi:superfamily II helicase